MVRGVGGTASASVSSSRARISSSHAGPSSSAASGDANLGASRSWTPLRDNYFEPPLLSARERAYLVRKACEAAQELVERARSSGGPIAWHHVEKRGGVQIYAGVPRSGAAGAALSAASMCGVTSVPGTVKEVAALFQLGSTRQMKEFARAHREWFYDGVLLHTLAPRTREKPLHQVTAKWMAVQTPSGLAHRDFCFLECQDKFIDARGRKGWVLGQHSIKLPGCDELKRAFGLVRGSLYHSGLVVVESEERAGHVDVIHLVQLNLKEHAPVPASFLRARVAFVAEVRNMLRSKRLNEQRYLSDLELVPRKYRARCAVCQDSFSLLLLRKLNCRKCGEVVCAACSKEFPIESRNLAATGTVSDEIRKLRICMHCFQQITNAPKPTTALAEAPHASTMSLSFLGYHDDDQRATFMTQGPPPSSSRRGHHGHDEASDQPPKIFLQSMRREKSSRQRRMSSTSPIPSYGGGVPPPPPSTARHRARGNEPGDEEYQQLYEQSQRYQQQQQQQRFEYGHTPQQHRQARTSQRMRPSDFRPSQSMSLDDPMGRGDDRYTLQMPQPPPAPSPASIFDRPSGNSTASRRQQNGTLPRSNSNNDMLDGVGGTMSNYSRLQELSSRDRREQLQHLQVQRQGHALARSSMDHRMPNAYVASLQQASREKIAFQAPPPVFGAYDATLDDHQAPPPLDMSALTSAAPPATTTTTATTSSKAVPRTPPNKVQQERPRADSMSSESSAGSIDIDAYDEPQAVAVAPSVVEKQQPVQEKVAPIPSAPPPSYLAPVHDSVLVGADDTDEDSEASLGASDDEEERPPSVKQPIVSAKTAVTSSQPPPRRRSEEDAEESKTQEFSATPALPPPSPSAHATTREMLTVASIANSSNRSMLDHVVPKVTEEEEEEDFIDHEDRLSEEAAENPADEQADLEADVVARKYTHPGTDDEDEEEEDIVDHSLSEEEGAGDDAFAQRDSELMLNTAGCDMNYLDADMRQFHDQSLFMPSNRGGGKPSFDGEQRFSAQLKDSMSSPSSVPSPTSAFISTTPSTIAEDVTAPYAHMPTSPDGDKSMPLDLGLPRPSMKYQRPGINREGTFALNNMAMEERQQSWNSTASPPASTRGVVLDAQRAPTENASVVSTTRTEPRFATTGISLLSVPVDEHDEEDLSFQEAQRDSEVPRLSETPESFIEEGTAIALPVVPVTVSLPVGKGDEEEHADAEEIVQTSGDEVSESRSRSSSLLSFSSIPSSSTRGSRVEATTPPTASTPPISRLSVASSTRLSSPRAASSELAASGGASSPLRANGSSEAMDPPPVSRSTSGDAPPAYVPDRFRTLQQLQQSAPLATPPKAKAKNPTPVVVSSPAGSNPPRQSDDSGAALDSFQLDFSSSFATNQKRVTQQQAAQRQIMERSSGVSSDGLAFPPHDERNRASSTSSTGSNDVQVLRYQPFESSVLDTVPDTEAPSASDTDEDEDVDADDSEDDNMLLSARRLYERFGNTRKLSRLAGGDRPSFQRTFSQIQKSFDQLSSDSDASDDDDDDLRPSVMVGRR
ncbi:hypothetical protein BBJ28_00008316 [Nothophytophthora sp. Chile5]|nr:hypothetical protein BBJ28_00008316 [Nothophytophthora sp. Chile5]